MSAHRLVFEIDRVYAGLIEQAISAVDDKRFPSRRARRTAERGASAVVSALVLARGQLRSQWRNAWRATWN